MEVNMKQIDEDEYFYDCVCKLKEELTRLQKVKYCGKYKIFFWGVRNNLRDVVYMSEVVDAIGRNLMNQCSQEFYECLDEDLRRMKGIETVEHNKEYTAYHNKKPNWLDRYGTSIKALFFFARAYHDCLVRLLLEAIGEKPGKGSSMKDYLKKEKSPIHVWIRENLPGYWEWFEDFRDKRNAIKDGAPTPRHSTYDGNKFSGGIWFLDFPSGEAEVDIPYLREIVDMSQKLTNVMIAEALNSKILQSTNVSA